MMMCEGVEVVLIAGNCENFILLMGLSSSCSCAILSPYAGIVFDSGSPIRRSPSPKRSSSPHSTPRKGSADEKNHEPSSHSRSVSP